MVKSKSKNYKSEGKSDSINNIEINKKKYEELNREYNSLMQKLNLSNNKYRVSIQNEVKHKETIKILKNQNESLVKDYSNSLYEIEKVLYNLSEEIGELRAQNKKYKELEKKYKALSNSKLGKITLAYWNMKRGYR